LGFVSKKYSSFPEILFSKFNGIQKYPDKFWYDINEMAVRQNTLCFESNFVTQINKSMSSFPKTNEHNSMIEKSCSQEPLKKWSKFF
jgi:hypothetical protein